MSIITLNPKKVRFIPIKQQPTARSRKRHETSPTSSTDQSETKKLKTVIINKSDSDRLEQSTSPSISTSTTTTTASSSSSPPLVLSSSASSSPSSTPQPVPSEEKLEQGSSQTNQLFISSDDQSKQPNRFISLPQSHQSIDTSSPDGPSIIFTHQNNYQNVSVNPPPPNSNTIISVLSSHPPQLHQTNPLSEKPRNLRQISPTTKTKIPQLLTPSRPSLPTLSHSLSSPITKKHKFQSTKIFPTTSSEPLVSNQSLKSLKNEKTSAASSGRFSERRLLHSTSTTTLNPTSQYDSPKTSKSNSLSNSSPISLKHSFLPNHRPPSKLPSPPSFSLSSAIKPTNLKHPISLSRANSLSASSDVSSRITLRKVGTDENLNRKASEANKLTGFSRLPQSKSDEELSKRGKREVLLTLKSTNHQSQAFLRSPNSSDNLNKHSRDRLLFSSPARSRDASNISSGIPILNSPSQTRKATTLKPQVSEEPQECSGTSFASLPKFTTVAPGKLCKISRGLQALKRSTSTSRTTTGATIDVSLKDLNSEKSSSKLSTSSSSTTKNNSYVIEESGSRLRPRRVTNSSVGENPEVNTRQKEGLFRASIFNNDQVKLTKLTARHKNLNEQRFNLIKIEVIEMGQERPASPEDRFRKRSKFKQQQKKYLSGRRSVCQGIGNRIDDMDLEEISIKLNDESSCQEKIDKEDEDEEGDLRMGRVRWKRPIFEEFDELIEAEEDLSSSFKGLNSESDCSGGKVLKGVLKKNERSRFDEYGNLCFDGNNGKIIYDVDGNEILPELVCVTRRTWLS
ncbi:hypothetical protein BY996DRAFT_8685269 [Phakopsora pachyrhizi]|nr:hypothetical protein BY996DRAFT_8685269 [Phakopsora pachyrhizi]